MSLPAARVAYPQDAENKKWTFFFFFFGSVKKSVIKQYKLEHLMSLGLSDNEKRKNQV